MFVSVQASCYVKSHNTLLDEIRTSLAVPILKDRPSLPHDLLRTVTILKISQFSLDPSTFHFRQKRLLALKISETNLTEILPDQSFITTFA